MGLSARKTLVRILRCVKKASLTWAAFPTISGGRISFKGRSRRLGSWSTGRSCDDCQDRFAHVAAHVEVKSLDTASQSKLLPNDQDQNGISLL